MTGLRTGGAGNLTIAEAGGDRLMKPGTGLKDFIHERSAVFVPMRRLSHEESC